VQARLREVAEAVRPLSRLTEALLRDAARPVAVEEGNVVVLQFRYAAHMAKMQESSNRIAVEKALRRVFGVPCKLRCVLAESNGVPFDRPRAQTTQDDPIVAKAVRMWGGRVLSPSELEAVEALPAVPDPTEL
jgi:hypothetical protein